MTDTQQASSASSALIAASSPQTPSVPPIPPPLSPADEAPDADRAALPGVVKYTIIALVALIILIIFGLLVAVIGGLTNSEGVANFFRILRDFFIVVLALQGILISVALIILVLQVSALVQLVRTEVKPIVDETREAVSTLRGTAQFLSKNVTAPIIRTSAAFSGATAFLREVTRLRRNVRPNRDD